MRATLATRRIALHNEAPLPDLINKLRDLVCGQYTEADRVLYGRGDLQLLPAYAKHCVTVDTWKSMSAAQRQKASDACFRQTVMVPSSTSTDSTVTVATTPGAGKKPHQRKHQRNERTHKSAKAARIEHCASDSDNDFM